MKIVGHTLRKEEKTPLFKSGEQRRDPFVEPFKPPFKPPVDAAPKAQCGLREKLTRAMRMNTFEVADVLKLGKRSRVKITTPGDVNARINAKSLPPKAVVEARTLVRNNAVMSTALVKHRVAPEHIGVRLAAAVPKRLLKKSVDRNLVKRWIKESVRQHPHRFARTDLLLTLTAKFNPKNQDDRVRVRQELSVLITDALSLVRASSKLHKPRGNG